jgi:PBSX family phage portal protein
MSDTEIKKGSVYIQTSKGVFPQSILKSAEIAKPSKQIKAENKWILQNGLIQPPYPFKVFQELREASSVFDSCVKQIASDVAGNGWTLNLREGQKDNKQEYGRLKAFLDNPNPEDSLRRMFEQLIMDLGTIGNFALEIARDTEGKVVNTYYIPAHTIRVHKSKEKYCQVRDVKKVWFKSVGNEENISSKTGETATEDNDIAHELIYYKNFYARSDYYGMPDILSAIGSVMGLVGLRDYNLSFFENYGVPAAIIILEGQWEDGSDKKITEFLDTEIKSSNNAHKTLTVMQPDGCKFTYQKLNVDVKESSFKLYEQMRRDDILMVYSMPPERIGIRVTGSLGGNVAEEATKIYLSSVVEPLQADLEEVVNNYLLKSEVYEFKFKDVDIRNLTADVDRMSKEIEHGLSTPNEARAELGRNPYPEGDVFYMLSSLIPIGDANADMSKTEKEFLKKQVTDNDKDKKRNFE